MTLVWMVLVWKALCWFDDGGMGRVLTWRGVAWRGLGRVGVWMCVEGLSQEGCALLRYSILNIFVDVVCYSSSYARDTIEEMQGLRHAFESPVHEYLFLICECKLVYPSGTVVNNRTPRYRFRVFRKGLVVELTVHFTTHLLT